MQKLITVYGTGKLSLKSGKAYQVSEKQAEGLIAKGAASLKPIKSKE